MYANNIFGRFIESLFVLHSTDLFNSHYYQYFDTATTFHEADAHASSLSFKGMTGHLVTFNHYDELAFILSVLPNKTSWVGLSDILTEGTFLYTDGPEAGQAVINIFPSTTTASNVLKWSGINPDNWSGIEDCVEIWSGDAMFNDITCEDLNTYYVEFDCPGVLIPSSQGCTSMNSCAKLGNMFVFGCLLSSRSFMFVRT
jgi:hypothetical protein